MKSPDDVHTVFVEPLWKLRAEYRYLLRYPPEGYRFVLRETLLERGSKALSRFDFAYRALFTLGKVAPMHLLKPYVERFKRVPAGTAITYAVLHPVVRQEPWILGMHGEQPHLLVGSESMFLRYRGRLRRLLASRYCRKVVCDVNAGKRAMLYALQAPELEEKIAVIPPAVPPKAVRRQTQADGVRLLFVGSANIDAHWQFRDKGGLILLEAFRVLREMYPTVELIIRSRVPRWVKTKWKGVAGLRIVEGVLPWDELQGLFAVSDMLVCPAHVTPSVTFIDALSYGLPVVTTDVWSNGEIIENGRTGLLVHHPQASLYTSDSWVHHDWPEFHEVVNRVNPQLVEGIVKAVRLLIENPHLRRQMGENGRREVEEGRFSLARRNQALKRILDESIATNYTHRTPA